MAAAPQRGRLQPPADMYFCPFCGTLLLAELHSATEQTRLFCATCRFVVGIHTNEPLTTTHVFTALNKKLSVDEEASTTPSSNAALGAGRCTEAPTEAASGQSASAAPRADQCTTEPTRESDGEWVVDDVGMEGESLAEGGQVMTVRCQNDEVPCSGAQAYYVQVQMRSADEPQTTFFKCVTCGFTWKQD